MSNVLEKIINQKKIDLLFVKKKYNYEVYVKKLFKIYDQLK